MIYAVDGLHGVATRFRQQINENSKMLCWHHIIPEMNHNELVGWAEQHEECAVVILRNSTDYYRSQARIEINRRSSRNAPRTSAKSGRGRLHAGAFALPGAPHRLGLLLPRRPQSHRRRRSERHQPFRLPAKLGER